MRQVNEKKNEPAFFDADCVRLKRAVRVEHPDDGVIKLKKGTSGTIIDTFGGPKPAHEVEFWPEKFSATVKEDDLELVPPAELEKTSKKRSCNGTGLGDVLKRRRTTLPPDFEPIS